ncbi:MAG TPA: amino acid adenylation domain-containing protein [Ktedonobacteraceae bacterium]|nr:amino acid adenylation domain-containing protein [Ktedonobacteraceae bacterium]
MDQACSRDNSMIDAAMKSSSVETAIVTKYEETNNKSYSSALLPSKDVEHQNRHFPLTVIQQVLWDTADLDNTRDPLYFELEGSQLNLERCNQVFQQLIDRHEMLRVVLHAGGQQEILEQVPLYQIEVIDLRGMLATSVTAQLATIRQDMSHRLFSVDQWPLFEIRASLLENQRVRFHIVFDRLITDLVGVQLFIHDWSQLYQKPETDLGAFEISFRDYVSAENDFHDTDTYRSLWSHWWNSLPAFPPLPRLPVFQEASTIKAPIWRQRQGILAPERWMRLKALAYQAGLTPAGLLCALFAEVLATWSEDPHFTLNFVYFDRASLHPQLNSLIGNFTSSIPLDAHGFRGTFEERTRGIQEQLERDLASHYFNVSRVLQALRRVQETSLQATNSVVFINLLPQDNLREERLSDASLGEIIYHANVIEQSVVELRVAEAEEKMIFEWNTLDDVFPENLIRDMFNAYKNILNRLSRQKRLWKNERLSLLPCAQLQQCAIVNSTELEVPPLMLHTLFTEQVPQRLHQPAVISPAYTLSYEDLYRHANQVGHHLRSLGAIPDTLVAVVMEKGWEQIVGSLGVLLSGAAYLPVDPHLPKERVWYILEYCEVKLILTQPWLNKTLEWPDSIRRVCVDTEDVACDNHSPLEIVQKPEDLAYVILTSGSTGLPKGVMIDHRGAVNTIIDINRRFAVGSEDRVLALSPLNFDLSVYDIFGILAAGGTIVLPDAQMLRDPGHWIEVMSREKVTIWNSVPALMDMFVAYAASRREVPVLHLRLALLSGDWIPVSLPGQLRDLVANIQVVSLGGATEASIWSILYNIDTVDSTWKSIPYGRPMVNQRFYVLNDALEPCPVWVTGQLYIAGLGLARGYWRDEEKTSKSFFHHPRTGERLYRTGDLGRYHPDGNIEFLGRNDYQVKIRGIRIELGEIQAVLNQHIAVRESVVLAVEDETSNKRLLAYVVPKQALLDPVKMMKAEAAQISQWQAVWEDVYNRPSIGHDSTFNIIGWNDSYRMRPFSDDEMHEWVNCTIERILSLQPSHVLEIGCGTGLLLFKIAPLCARYHATDLSQAALHSIQEQLTNKTQESPKVVLLQREAHDFSELEAETFDTIILNSVIQYFPSIDYLLRVLEKAVKVAKPGGAIFIGDIRSFPLLAAFHSSVQLYQAPISMPVSELRYLAQQHIEQERELAIDPDFFIALKSHLPKISRVEIQLKRGHHHNELTKFRYDVILYVGQESYLEPEQRTLDWQNQALTPHHIQQLLQETAPAMLRITRIPNQRIFLDVKAANLLVSCESIKTAGELREAVHEMQNIGVDPEEMWDLGNSLSYVASLGWSHSGSEYYDVVFRKSDSSGAEDIYSSARRLLNSVSERRPWNDYANVPLRSQSLPLELRSFLERKLPEYMIPSAISILDSLPLTPNGKVDRKVLMSSGLTSLSVWEKAGTLPRTSTEETLAALWTQVLGLRQVNIHANFFEIGGQSLLAVQLISRASEIFNVELPLRCLFEAPTIASLAMRIEQIYAPRGAANGY